MADSPIFEEKHYLGFNKYSLIRRTVFAIFCFLAYYFSDHEKVVSSKVGQMTKIVDTGDLFFLMGLVILVWSTVLVFILHMKTQVFNGYIILDGLWTSRRVKIDLNSIEKVEQIPYSKYQLNRPVYNLHRRGKIRFYTRGNKAVQLTDKDGLIYIIGSQHPIQLQEAVHNQLSNVN